MKRFIAATLAVIMLFTFVPTSVFASEVSAEQSQSESEYTYSVSGDNAVITHYNGDDMFVDIPNSIDGYNVTEIASSAFNNVDDVRGIEIPEGVEKLQKGIFTNCSNVEYISLPSTIKDIDDGVLNANSNCVYIVERNSQADTYATQNDLNFRRRFASDLVSDAGVSGDLRYHYNYITNAFYLYGSGSCVNYSNSNQPWNTYKASIQTVKILGDVSSIGNYAFYDCKSLKSIDLGNVSSIGISAFGNCSGITGKLEIPDSVTSIGNSAFSNCSGITELKISENLKTISYYTFSSCTSLKSLVIPDSVETVEYDAFYNCKSVESIVVGSGIKRLGTSNYYSNNPFYQMSGVKTVTFKSENVPTADYADIFQSMDGLETVYVPAVSYSKYVSSYTSIINNAKIVMSDNSEDFVVDEDGTLLVYQGDSSSVVVPDNVKKIGTSAFKNNRTITSVEMSSVEEIGNGAFYNCTSLKKVTFSDNLTKVGSSAFRGCSSLDNIALSDDITSIGAYAFADCTSLSAVTIPKGIDTLGDYVFYGCTALSGDVVISENIKTIGAYAFQNDSKITSVDIKGNADGTTIGGNAFYGCTGVKSVTLGNVVSIGTSAFGNCSGITGKLEISNSVTSIGNNAFANCSGITELKISENLKTIAYYTFSSCTSLKSLVIPDSVETVEYDAFYNCRSVESIVVGSGIKRLGTSNYYSNNPFYQMSGVKTVTFKSENVPTADYADIFQSMDGLEIIYVPVASYAKYVAAYTPYMNNARILMDSEDDFVIDNGVLLQYSGSETNVVIPEGVKQSANRHLRTTQILRVLFSAMILKLFLPLHSIIAQH